MRKPRRWLTHSIRSDPVSCTPGFVGHTDRPTVIQRKCAKLCKTDQRRHGAWDVLSQRTHSTSVVVVANMMFVFQPNLPSLWGKHLGCHPNLSRAKIPIRPVRTLAPAHLDACSQQQVKDSKGQLQARCQYLDAISIMPYVSGSTIDHRFRNLVAFNPSPPRSSNRWRCMLARN